MLCVWWDKRGVIHYEIISDGYCYWWDTDGVRQEWRIPDRKGKRAYTLNSEVYKAQVERLYLAVLDKRPDRRGCVILQQDNARPHVARDVVRLIEDELKWELLCHPPYSPTEAPSDYHLFRSLHNWQLGKRYRCLGELCDDVQAFFDVKDHDFFQKGIERLPHKWEAAIEVEGDYPLE